MPDSAARKDRRTTMVPVTTMEEVPILSSEERAELIAALQESEADIKAGRGKTYDSKTLTERLMRIYRGEEP